MYSIQDKIEALNMSSQGMNSKKIYDNLISVKYPNVSYDSFQRSLRNWKKNPALADPKTLNYGTYPKFEAHGATVQVNGSGEIVQAWIKQHHNSVDIGELITAIKEHTTPVFEIPEHREYQSDHMLEIPLYDMHFPLSDYKDTLTEIVSIMNDKVYDEINIIVGQDLFHNDDFRGRTTSGRVIEKYNMIEAWHMAEKFYMSIINSAIMHANRVNLIYSKGNHDETLAWAFVQLLKCMYDKHINVDDSLKSRKCIHWRKCFIGISHGCMKKNNDNKSMRGQFTIDFPQEFADSTAREIHVGHLHHEEAKDIYGVTVRRLSSAVPTDEWSDDEGYIGAHKRFMIFEWSPEKLHSIHFI